LGETGFYPFAPPSGFRPITRSSTGVPLARSSSMTRSRFFGVSPPYQVALGVDDGDGAAFADAQAAHLRPVDAARLARPVELRDALLQLAPGGRALLFAATIGAEAEEDVALIAADAVALGFLAGFVEVRHGAPPGFVAPIVHDGTPEERVGMARRPPVTLQPPGDGQTAPVRAATGPPGR
jgi:hypothetical protein